jgi:hypothetical protein
VALQPQPLFLFSLVGELLDRRGFGVGLGRSSQGLV